MSGIDTNSLLDQLVAVEQQKVTAIQTKQSNAQVALTNVGTVQSMLSTLSSKATAVSKTTSFDLFKSTSSNSAVATITGTGEGVQGNIDVNVQQMASSWKIASSAQSSSVTGLNLSGTLHLSKSAAALKADNSTSTVDVTIAAGDTLKDIATKINAAGGAGVNATVVTFGTGDVRLMLNSADTGSDSFSITESGGGTVLSGLGLKSSSSRETSAFQLRQAAGGAATSTTTLGQLYTGIGANNVASGDTLSLSWTNGGASGSVAAATADAIIGGGSSGASMKDVTVAQLTAWMKTSMGVTDVSVDSSGKIVATNSNGNAITFTLGMGAGSTGTIPLGGSKDSTSWTNILQQGQDAFYTMDGLSVATSTNSDSTTLAGATLNLVGVSRDSSGNPTTATTTLSLEKDTDGIQQKVQDLLDSYNALQDYIKQETTSTVQSKKDSNGTSMNQVTPGSLSYDTAVTSLANQLRTLMTSPIAQLSGKTQYTSLASVGITTDKDSGHLTIDSTKFQAALGADADGVSRLFANSGWTTNGTATVGGWTNNTKSGTYTIDPTADTVDGVHGNRVGDILFSTSGDSNGLGVTAPTSIGSSFTATFARGIGGLISQFATQASGIDGILTADQSAIQKRISDYGDQATKEQDRVDTYRSNMQAQFTAMETAMQKLKSQNSAFLAQIGG